MQNPAKRLVLPIALALVLVGILNAVRLSGCADTYRVRKGFVTRVYDGDTIEVSGAGKVRLIGVDALDGYNREKTREQARRLGLSEERVTEWADRATQFVRERVLNKEVRLERGPEARGDYGRLLGYVFYRDGASEVHLNRVLLKRGLAMAYRRYKHPRRDQFIQAEHLARKNREGLWQEASNH